jgi:hypothetical protein
MMILPIEFRLADEGDRAIYGNSHMTSLVSVSNHAGGFFLNRAPRTKVLAVERERGR